MHLNTGLASRKHAICLSTIVLMKDLLQSQRLLGSNDFLPLPVAIKADRAAAHRRLWEGFGNRKRGLSALGTLDRVPWNRSSPSLEPKVLYEVRQGH